mmetsp:Transcript_13833/g.30515  ORF Transcript_13833/g.30515 Transcript_13833/m.30515 type:complete len:351 (+) Transcript_13833:159-1211(+)
MLHMTPTAKSLVAYCLAYPFVIRALYLLRQSFDPFYMNSTCLLDLVRLSSPEHYDLHPLWKFYQQGSNETCESVTGMPISQFFTETYSMAAVEFYIFYAVIIPASVIGLALFAKDFIKGKGRSIVGIIGSVILSWNHGSLFHLLSHYQNDLSHINGNVMHHSSFTVGGDNSSFVNTLPPGLLINLLTNFLFCWMMMSVLLDYFKLDKWAYLNLSPVLILAKLMLQMKVVHPYVHAHQESWYGAVLRPILGDATNKYLIDDFKGHVMVHHVSGFCLGDGPIYNWFYDLLMFYHGKVYELGYVKFKAVEHYAFNYLLDYFLLTSVFGFMAITVFVLYPILPKMPADKKAKVL